VLNVIDRDSERLNRREGKAPLIAIRKKINANYIYAKNHNVSISDAISEDVWENWTSGNTIKDR